MEKERTIFYSNQVGTASYFSVIFLTLSFSFQRCKYDTCLCKDSEECLCAALSSYSRACAFKGIILGGWRQSVCCK